MTEELERLRKSLGGELVPYGAYEPVGPTPAPARIRVRRGAAGGQQSKSA